MRAVKLVKGDELWRENPPQIVIHSLKHLFPLELSITHDVKERELIVNDSDTDVIDESLNDDIDVMEDARDYEPINLNDMEGETFTSEVRSDDGFTPVSSSLASDTISDVPLESRSRRRVVSRRPLDNEFIFTSNMGEA